jgi:hypothetical protein
MRSFPSIPRAVWPLHADPELKHPPRAMVTGIFAQSKWRGHDVSRGAFSADTELTESVGPHYCDSVFPLVWRSPVSDKRKKLRGFHLSEI